MNVKDMENLVRRDRNHPVRDSRSGYVASTSTRPYRVVYRAYVCRLSAL
eukprot:COSAG02_NODE_36224_length_457_cov_1.013966_2_plen_48_part_01